jgi:hypothetical protein
MDAAKCAYWRRQWGILDPHVEPVRMQDRSRFLLMHRDCGRPGTLERRREQLVRAHNRDVDRT